MLLAGVCAVFAALHGAPGDTLSWNDARSWTETVLLSDVRVAHAAEPETRAGAASRHTKLRITYPAGLRDEVHDVVEVFGGQVLLRSGPPPHGGLRPMRPLPVPFSGIALLEKLRWISDTGLRVQRAHFYPATKLFVRTEVAPAMQLDVTLSAPPETTEKELGALLLYARETMLAPESGTTIRSRHSAKILQRGDGESLRPWLVELAVEIRPILRSTDSLDTDRRATHIPAPSLAQELLTKLEDGNVIGPVGAQVESYLVPAAHARVDSLQARAGGLPLPDRRLLTQHLDVERHTGAVIASFDYIGGDALGAPPEEDRPAATLLTRWVRWSRGSALDQAALRLHAAASKASARTANAKAVASTREELIVAARDAGRLAKVLAAETHITVDPTPQSQVHLPPNVGPFMRNFLSELESAGCRPTRVRGDPWRASVELLVPTARPQEADLTQTALDHAIESTIRGFWSRVAANPTVERRLQMAQIVPMRQAYPARPAGFARTGLECELAAQTRSPREVGRRDGPPPRRASVEATLTKLGLDQRVAWHVTHAPASRTADTSEPRYRAFVVEYRGPGPAPGPRPAVDPSVDPSVRLPSEGVLGMADTAGMPLMTWLRLVDAIEAINGWSIAEYTWASETGRAQFLLRAYR